MQYNTMGQRFKHALYLIKTKPKRLMWLFFLCFLANLIIAEACQSFLILSLPITYGLSAGCALLALKTVRNEEPEPKDIFYAFKDLKTAKRVIGGQLWSHLIVSVWMVVPAIISLVLAMALGYSGFYGAATIEDFMYFADFSDLSRTGIFIGVAGIAVWVFTVIFIVKSFEIAFVPYILLTREDISPFDAWKESKKLTYGLKGRMFGFAVLPALAFAVVLGILVGLSFIPFIGSVFLIAVTALILFAVIFLPYFWALGFAGFYEASLHAPKVVYEYPAQQGYPAAMPMPMPEPMPEQPIPEQPAPEPQLEPTPEPEAEPQNDEGNK